MDEAVTTSMKRATPLTTTAALAALLALAGAAGAADAAAAAIPETAQRLPDPTRPPAAALQAPPGSGPGAAAVEVLPQLQSVLLGAAGSHRIAVIDGQGVRVGDSFRGARVVRIADSEVELQRGRERQVLRLYVQDSAGGMTRVPAGAAHRSGGRQ
jgi:MSHA biogenesis protein MshK